MVTNNYCGCDLNDRDFKISNYSVASAGIVQSKSHENIVSLITSSNKTFDVSSEGSLWGVVLSSAVVSDSVLSFLVVKTPSICFCVLIND